MKTRYTYIHFVERGLYGPKRKYDCLNNKSESLLGRIEFYPHWQKYVFSAKENAVFDTDCLKDIIDFMEQL